MWLQLTEKDGKVVYVNMDNIVRIGTYQNGLTGLASTAVQQIDAFDIFVRESPDEIMDMIERGAASEDTH